MDQSVSKARKRACKHENTKLVDYDPAFHDGRVICADCKAFIRWWDAG